MNTQLPVIIKPVGQPEKLKSNVSYTLGSSASAKTVTFTAPPKA